MPLPSDVGAVSGLQGKRAAGPWQMQDRPRPAQVLQRTTAEDPKRNASQRVEWNGVVE